MDASASSQIFTSGFILVAIKLVYAVAIIVIPIFLALAFWKNWVKYVRAAFFVKQKLVLLELMIPKGLAKSPLAMELVITALHQTGGEGTWYDKYYLGKTRPWFSLEIISIEGNVRFLIWTRDNWRAWIESQLYAQFPDIEIRLVKDYASGLNFNWEEHSMWGCDFIKGAATHLPIKTYVHYGLDKDPKEEFKIDPITSVIEFMGSLGRGEQYWLQIGVRAHKAELPKPGTWNDKVDWKHGANEDIKKLMSRDKKPKEGEINIKELSMTKGEKEKVEAIEKNISKLAFDCLVRGIYVAKKDSFRGNLPGAITGLLRQYSSPNLNAFKPSNAPGFDYPWQDFGGKKEKKRKENIMEAYVERSFFYPEFYPSRGSVEYKGKPFVMTTEEIATMYHFPGDVARTPSLSRVTAKKAEPPSNLPI